MYAKLFASLYEGTLRGRADEILVFTNLLAYADARGVVDRHWRVISEDVGISRDRVMAAISALEAPDPESRSPEEEGRRIVRLDEHRLWGWRIVNHGKYSAIRHAGDRQAQNREAQKRWREKLDADNKQHKQNKPRKPPSAHSDSDTDIDSDKESERRASAPRTGSRLPKDWKPSEEDCAFADSLGMAVGLVAPSFRDYWHGVAGAKGRKVDWSATWRNWVRREAENRDKPSRDKPRWPNGFSKPDPQAMPAAEPWEQRLVGWRERKQWLPQVWGPPPGQPGYRGPKA